MQRLFSCFLFSVFCFLTFSARAAEIIDLDRGWRFTQAGRRSQIVDLPHTWNSDALGADRAFHRSEGNYLRTVDIPAAWQGRRLFVRFGAAGSVCDLIVGGRHVGQHRGGYTSFTFEITDFVRFGAPNTLQVAVNNSPRSDVLPTAGDATPYGGLIRGVELIVADGAAFAPEEGVRIASHKTSGDDFVLSAAVRVIASTEKTLDVAATLLDADGKSVATARQRIKATPKASSTTTLTLPIAAPHRWNGTLDPYLYTLEVNLTDGAVAYDSTRIATGFREMVVDPARGFLLNGAPYPLRGVSITPDRPLIGTAVRPRHIAADIAIAREMGANFLISLPREPLFYEECDRLGIVVMSQLPLLGATRMGSRGYFPTTDFRQNGREQLLEMIRQQQNHPSVAIWSLFDGLTMRGDDPTAYIKELHALARKEDPQRLTACVSNQDGAINLVTDLILWKHTFGWSEGQPADIAVWLDHLHRSWSTLRSAIAYGAGGNIDQQADPLVRPDPASGFHPENWQTYLHEQYWTRLKDDRALWAVVAGPLFDRADLDADPLGIDDRGLVTMDRAERKAAFRFYRNSWNPKN